MSNKHGSSYALQHPEHNGFSEQHNFTIVLVTASNHRGKPSHDVICCKVQAAVHPSIASNSEVYWLKAVTSVTVLLRGIIKNTLLH